MVFKQTSSVPTSLSRHDGTLFMGGSAIHTRYRDYPDSGLILAGLEWFPFGTFPFHLLTNDDVDSTFVLAVNDR